MSYEVELSPSARRALTRDLPEAVAAAVLEFLRGPLAENPHRVGRPLRGSVEGLRSARRGDYRVIYEIQEHRVVVRVIRMQHRRDAYRP
ncbi:addiction module toxin, RelE/StbE family [Quadrisphaera granulorum]|uniref:Addiction module RelE/StbE family toxin n=1 Tax=Quadrisphaera granulorum TaxID=317664 RepID=A0A316A9L1_9ACTN|nr:type II toxin-antitoxin system RelE/ParE family toxin [Quadrisphaera granulorum]PWJ54606.1 addiction module RelE/StbE family toxin [Quadrisphaera granulorum]SZE95968.1 addiction module toxin, RelE/StbE family [Quadrisphaera granulorum]